VGRTKNWLLKVEISRVNLVSRDMSIREYEPVSRAVPLYSTLGSRIPHTPGKRFFCRSSFECILRNSIADEGGDDTTEDDAGFVVRRGTYSVLPGGRSD
jgi:hypothetical protein